MALTRGSIKDGVDRIKKRGHLKVSPIFGLGYMGKEKQEIEEKEDIVECPLFCFPSFVPPKIGE